MFKPLTHLNQFFDLATEKTLSGSDQLVYLHLFNKFNRAHWAETISVRDRELLNLCRLYDTNGKPASLDTIRNAKARLKKKGFIDFEAGKGENPTIYRFIPFVDPADTLSTPPADTPADTPADLGQSSYIRVREDVKDVKTIIQENQSARARACVNTEIDEYPIDKLLDEWERSGGSKLNGVIVSELDALLKKPGNTLELLTAACKLSARKNNNSNYGYSFEFFLNRLEELKEGERVDRQQSTSASNDRADYSYKKPEYTDKPWESD